MSLYLRISIAVAILAVCSLLPGTAEADTHDHFYTNGASNSVCSADDYVTISTIAWSTTYPSPDAASIIPRTDPIYNGWMLREMYTGTSGGNFRVYAQFFCGENGMQAANWRFGFVNGT